VKVALYVDGKSAEAASSKVANLACGLDILSFCCGLFRASLLQASGLGPRKDPWHV